MGQPRFRLPKLVAKDYHQRWSPCLLGWDPSSSSVSATTPLQLAPSEAAMKGEPGTSW